MSSVKLHPFCDTLFSRRKSILKGQAMFVDSNTSLEELKRIAQQEKKIAEELLKTPLPPLTEAQQNAIRQRAEESKERARKGQEWFKHLSGELQRFPVLTLVGINVETGEYFTAPEGLNDLEDLERQFANGSPGGYWVLRLKEGSDGKKYPGGVYSLGSASLRVA
jgi:hypothetical protein